MRGRLQRRLVDDAHDRVVRALARRAAGAVGDRDELAGAAAPAARRALHSASSIFSVLGGKNSKETSISPAPSSRLLRSDATAITGLLQGAGSRRFVLVAPPPAGARRARATRSSLRPGAPAAGRQIALAAAARGRRPSASAPPARRRSRAGRAHARSRKNSRSCGAKSTISSRPPGASTRAASRMASAGSDRKCSTWCMTTASATSSAQRQIINVAVAHLRAAELRASRLPRA